MGIFGATKIFCIFDLLNVNKYMLKNSVFINVSHIKYQKNLVSLHTFNAVIINITKLSFILFRKSYEGKRFPIILEAFFLCQNFTLLTNKI